MVEQDKKLMRHMWANIVILIVAVFAILLLTQQENYARQMQQIDKTSRRAGFWIFRAEDDARQMRV